MPLTVKVPGRSVLPMGVGIRESRAVGSLIPHSLTHSRASLTGQAPPEGLSIPPGPLGPDLTWGLAADTLRAWEPALGTQRARLEKTHSCQRRAVGSHASKTEVGQERLGNPGPWP